MKVINLISVLNANNDLSKELFNKYLKCFGIDGIKKSELEDISSLVESIKTHSRRLNIFDGYYIGFTINQISKEFDLLRFGIDNIINIELKRNNTGDKMKKQLIMNKYYLSFLDKQVYNFTYVSEDDTLFYLNDSDELEHVDFDYLISLLENQDLEEIYNIQSLFNPSNYLISPFNSTKEFIEGKYFLTDHQLEIKKNILKLISSGSNFITIEGNAGTGKTLLSYDLAHEYINKSKSVLVVHCGKLNNGHKILSAKYGWDIIQAKDLLCTEIDKYYIILVDEVQRMFEFQLEYLIKKVKELEINCIFSYDKKQCLSSKEIKRDNPTYIKNNTSSTNFKLTDRIRSNKEIASFIKGLFDLSKVNKNISYSNINIKYFSEVNKARKYTMILHQQGWEGINYTPGFNNYPYEKLNVPFYDNAHEVIGQEYDNVVAIIDQYFYYNENKMLSTKGYNSKPLYHPTKMLFQILTRSRKKLTIVIVNNPEILEKCLQIINCK
ncbi:DUF2075 domain-containing protein [Paeniclostridium sordellii]|uniref:DNA/RNA helicase domain-containing protein n=1 Tax=Paraclostridium sordellii TaxID=1505 RepID=UPI00210E1458|nr:DNA/RNA helicase domain-containing protein [Paeniclostridium sordellii]MCQ4699070.1 DUF2075 domain-containing protein [Paeniclostridium sordellii]